MAKKFDYVVTRVDCKGIAINNVKWLSTLTAAKKWIRLHCAAVNAAGVYFADYEKKISYRIYKYEPVHGFLTCIYIN